jgi:hypothetical protein
VVIPAIIDWGVSNDPYIGELLSRIVSILILLLVFVTYPCIVLGERGAIDAISVSIHHFMDNKLQLFITVKSHVLEDVRADRHNKGLQDLRSSSFYHAMIFWGGGKKNYSQIVNIFKYLLLITH